jgi:hypothetical protein
MDTSWYFIGGKPQQKVCDHCGVETKILHSLELHGRENPQTPQARVCLECAEVLVRDADRGLPTWAESISKRGGLGFEGWTSRWHWEDFNGPWEPVEVGARRV